jgi:hypothetical protein
MHDLWSKAWLGVALASLLATAGCGSHHNQQDAGRRDAALMDAEEAPDVPVMPDAGPMPEPGPTGTAFTTAGGRSSSPHFVVFSTTGQSTPVSAGEMKSPSYSVTPGILGGK